MGSQFQFDRVRGINSYKMKSVFLLTAFLIGLSRSIPVEDPNDQVELVKVENTNKGDPELSLGGAGGDVVPVIILRTSSNGGSPFGSGGFPSLFKTFFGGSGDSGEVDLGESLFPSIKNFHQSLVPEIDPKDFLGVTEDGEEDGETAADDKCDGLLCLLFKALGTRVKHIEDEIKEIQQNRENEVEEESREPETTYEEKVLDDGTIVKINRTRYSDVSQDGSAYFGFHSTSFVSGSGGDEKDGKKEDAAGAGKVAEETTTEETVDSVVQDYDDSKDESAKQPIKLVKKNDNLRR